MPYLDSALALKFVDRIYEAALDPPLWRAVLADLADLYDGKAVFFMQDLARGNSGVAEFSGFDRDCIDSYVAYYGARSPWTAELARLPAGAVVTEEMLTPPAVLKKTEFYADWLRPQGLHAAVRVILEKTGTVATNFAINRAADRGPITAEEVRFVSVLAPHMRRAVRMNRQLSAARLERDVSLAALDDLSIGVMIADAEGRLLFANPGAERLLRDERGLSVQCGRLVGATPAATTLLRATIKTTADPASSLPDLRRKGRSSAAQDGIVRLPSRAGAFISVLVGPLPREAGAQAFGLPGSAVILFVRVPASNGGTADEARLAKLYGLTRVEARLMAAVLGGMELKRYAEANRVSMNTVKTQLKSVFAKTGLHRQAELVRHVLADPLVRLG